MPYPNLRQAPGAYNGLATKIKFARNAWTDSLVRPEVRAFAEASAGKGSRVVQAQRLFNALREHVRYYNDHFGIESTKAPWVMIHEIKTRGWTGEDCDGQATLAYVLLRSIGIPANLRVGWYGQNQNPGHIYALAYLNGDWVPFDTTMREMGKEQPYAKARDFA
jgi:transglutaminase-like putative cysteine protease